MVKSAYAEKLDQIESQARGFLRGIGLLEAGPHLQPAA